MMDEKTMPKVAFVCVRNTCRSQMAEAIAHIRFPGVIEAFSAGTEPDREVDPIAADVIEEIYGVDMRKLQHPKPLSSLPRVDVVVTMGCGASCPSVPAKIRLDWGLEDPMGGPHDAYVACARLIEEKLDLLASEVGGQAADGVSGRASA
ncbi:MAG: phosphotyrosine protein phosphatase [Eggerthellaceae bacterium]|jgi:arsenate reductase|nr:phosphotyrosine protein phosphatase [Eggerthellaceae bacterium]